MNRLLEIDGLPNVNVPRERGDEPQNMAILLTETECSPRARG